MSGLRKVSAGISPGSAPPRFVHRHFAVVRGVDKVTGDILCNRLDGHRRQVPVTVGEAKRSGVRLQVGDHVELSIGADSFGSDVALLTSKGERHRR